MRYLLFRGALYCTAYKDMSGPGGKSSLMDEEESLKIESWIKLMGSSLAKIDGAYPKAKEQYGKLKAVLVGVNPTLEQYLSEGEVGTFNKRRYQTLKTQIAGLAKDKNYLGMFKFLNKKISDPANDAEDFAMIDEYLAKIYKMLADESEALGSSNRWLEATAGLNTKLLNLLNQIKSYRSSKQPNEKAAYQKFVQKMGKPPEEVKQLISSQVEFVHGLSSAISAVTPLFQAYGRVLKKVADKLAKVKGKVKKPELKPMPGQNQPARQMEAVPPGDAAAPQKAPGVTDQQLQQFQQKRQQTAHVKYANHIYRRVTEERIES